MSKAAAAPAPAGDAPKGKKKLVPIIGAAVIAAGAAGGGAWWFASKKAADGAHAAPKVEAPKPPQFVNLEPFVVNLKDDGTNDHFLQTALAFQVADGAAADAIKLHLPVIRGKILLLLSSKSSTELAPVEAKTKLADEIVVAARGTLPAAPAAEGEQKDARKGILAVHFASFIIQ